MHLDSGQVQAALARRKFRSRVGQVLSLNIAFMFGIAGMVSIILDPALIHTPWAWSLLGFLYPFGYGLNELFKLIRMQVKGWFLCFDCRRATENRKKCTRMNNGVVVEICRTCVPHLEPERPLIPKHSTSLGLWASGGLKSKSVEDPKSVGTAPSAR